MDNAEVIELAIKDRRVLVSVEPHLKNVVAERLGMRWDYSHITLEQAIGLGCENFWTQINEDEDGESWTSLHTNWDKLVQ